MKIKKAIIYLLNMDHLDEKHVETIAKKIHILHINKKRNFSKESIISEWDNVAAKTQKRYISMAKLSIVCVSSKIPIDDTASILHNNWISLNEKNSTELQKRTYCLQSDHEKKKYNDVINLVKELEIKEISYIS